MTSTHPLSAAPALRPSADAISRVRNRAAALADTARRRNQHPDSETTASYERALGAFEVACVAARAEGVLAAASIQRAVRDAAGRPDRLGALLTITDTVDLSSATEPVYHLVQALRPFKAARQAASA
jgi:hypothetical protein